MFQITAHGNLGKDPELKTFEDGSRVANFSLAVSTGKDETTWMSCQVWGKRAEIVCDFLQKGSKITIAGRAKLTTYTNKNNEEKTSLRVTVHDFTLPVRTETSRTDTWKAPDEEMPF